MDNLSLTHQLLKSMRVRHNYPQRVEPITAEFFAHVPSRRAHEFERCRPDVHDVFSSASVRASDARDRRRPRAFDRRRVDRRIRRVRTRSTARSAARVPRASDAASIRGPRPKRPSHWRAVRRTISQSNRLKALFLTEYDDGSSLESRSMREKSARWLVRVRRARGRLASRASSRVAATPSVFHTRAE